MDVLKDFIFKTCTQKKNQSINLKMNETNLWQN